MIIIRMLDTHLLGRLLLSCHSLSFLQDESKWIRLRHLISSFPIIFEAQDGLACPGDWARDALLDDGETGLSISMTCVIITSVSSYVVLVCCFSLTIRIFVLLILIYLFIVCFLFVGKSTHTLHERLLLLLRFPFFSLCYHLILFSYLLTYLISTATKFILWTDVGVESLNLVCQHTIVWMFCCKYWLNDTMSTYYRLAPCTATVICLLQLFTAIYGLLTLLMILNTKLHTLSPTHSDVLLLNCVNIYIWRKN